MKQFGKAIRVPGNRNLIELLRHRNDPETMKRIREGGVKAVISLVAFRHQDS